MSISRWMNTGLLNNITSDKYWITDDFECRAGPEAGQLALVCDDLIITLILTIIIIIMSIIV